MNNEYDFRKKIMHYVHKKTNSNVHAYVVDVYAYSQLYIEHKMRGKVQKLCSTYRISGYLRVIFCPRILP